MNTTTSNKFWMVKGLGATAVQHPTREAAVHEAQRLARLHVNQCFYLLETTSVFAVTQLPVAEHRL